MLTRSARVAKVSRLLFKTPQANRYGTKPDEKLCGVGMVKREPVKVIVGSAATVNALADTRIAKKKSVKDEGVNHVWNWILI